MFIRAFYVPHSILNILYAPQYIVCRAAASAYTCRAYAILPYAFTESSCYATMHNT